VSTSYQDIDVRLVGVENALKFLMESMRVRTAGPLTGPDGTPLVRDLSMYEFYREQLALGLLELVKPTSETSDGTNAD
jgi:hypothetical protein